MATSVMGFEYKDVKINILDTPGHQDFAEDTFRVLTACDSVIIVVDSAKGVETQTRKLMQVWPDAPDPGHRVHQQARPPPVRTRSTCWTRSRKSCKYKSPR